jgi:fatty-acyl-CoA synthase
VELHLATLWESIADAIPEQDAVLQGSTRLRWGEYDERAARLASAFMAAGLGRGSKVALYLYNSPAYAEAHFAALKLGGIPINVNYRYLADELGYVLENSDAEAVVFHTSLAEQVERARRRVPSVKVWLAVDDGPDSPVHADRYEDVVHSSAPASRIRRHDDDVYMLYTGGTTGRPKAVIYRMGDQVSSFLGQLSSLLRTDALRGASDAAPLARRLSDEGRRYKVLPTAPLMHGTGLWAGLVVPHLAGGTSVLLRGRSLDAGEVWGTADAQRVTAIAIVGDAIARPLLRRLEQAAADGQPYDLGPLRFLISAGAMFSAEVKSALVDLLPELVIIDTIGATEGVVGVEVTRRDKRPETARFKLLPTTKVLTADGREVAPGSGEIGLLAVGGNVPVGYYKDEAKSAATFRDVNGVRYSIPGDWATVRADGTIKLLGRGNQCINTGGEKVFPEEVEEAVRTHPAVDDCLVFGVPDERFGERVVAVVAPAPKAIVTEDEVIAHTRRQLAGYKAPRRVIFVDAVPRTASGKADYTAARRLYTGDKAAAPSA